MRHGGPSRTASSGVPLLRRPEVSEDLRAPLAERACGDVDQRESELLVDGAVDGFETVGLVKADPANRRWRHEAEQADEQHAGLEPTADIS
jgi:hypothetical protein